jgi:hypothetical protein
VLGVIDGDQEAAQSCDPATDQLIVHWPQVICARHVGGRHVSAAGLGGGVLVPGDCVHLTLEMLLPDPTEVPCTDPGYQAKVISRVGTAAECTAPAVHYEKLATDRGPVLCLATGPGIAGPSQCLHAENSAVHYAPVPCTDGQATHRVLARTASDAACPPGTTSYTEDAGGLPSTKIVCLHELKTHGIDN